MARSDPDAPFLSEREIEALRHVLQTKRIRAAWRKAEVEKDDYTNFITMRGGKPKTQTPSDNFQRRMLDFIVHTRGSLATDDLKVLKDVELLIKKWKTTARVSNNDHLFNYLNSIGVIGRQQCEAICAELCGKYDLYRLSSDPEAPNVHRSHLEILPFDIYEKLPRFENRIVLDAGRQRIAAGHIIRLGNAYILFGLVRSNEAAAQRTFLGSKVMILRRVRQKPVTLMGLYYTSGSEEIYDLGATRAVLTGREFNRNDKDIFSITPGPLKEMEAEFKKNKLPTRLNDIALRFFPGPLVIEDMIFASLAFNIKNPKGKRLS
jgi:hypothetical protein